MDWDAIAVISAVVLTVGGGHVAMLLSLLSKVSTLIAQVDHLIEASRHNTDDHGRIWERLDAHGHRITKLERNGSDR